MVAEVGLNKRGVATNLSFTAIATAPDTIKNAQELLLHNKPIVSQPFAPFFPFSAANSAIYQTHLVGEVRQQ